MKLLQIKNWNIFSKILGLSLTAVIPFALFLLLEILPSIKASMLENKKANIKQTVEVAYGILQTLNEDYTEGKLTLDEAKNEAIHQIKQLRFADDNYFWLNDDYPNMIMHPFKPELNGKSLRENKDPNGVYIFNEMVKVCKQNGEGFVDYHWPKPGYKAPIPKISFVKHFDQWNWIIGAGLYVEDVNESIAALSSKIFLIFGILLLVSFSLIIFSSLKISKPIKELSKAAELLASGETNVEVNINSTDEVGNLALNFNTMSKNIRDSIIKINSKTKEAEEAAKAAKEAQRESKENENYLSVSTNQMLHEMEIVSQGDLTSSLTIQNENDNIGKLFSGFNYVISNINSVLKRVHDTVDLTTSSANEISATMEQMSAGAQEQSSQSQEIATAVEQMTKTILETSKNSSTAFKSSTQSSEHANMGKEKVKESINKMNEIVKTNNETAKTINSLANRTNQIGNIAKVINEIADQTNLLALNAAIEAARAGEQGRGFAVVADEVRKLAERTAVATKEIADTILEVQNDAQLADSEMNNSKSAVDGGMSSIKELELLLSEISENAENVKLEINQVATASEELSATAEQIGKNIYGISTVSNENAEGIHQVSKSITELSKNSELLQNLIETFKLDNSSNTKNSKKIITQKVAANY